MATPREQFIELRKSGKTPVEARQAIMNTVAPPVSATSQDNIDQLAANKAKVQAEIQAGTRPELGTSATPQAGQTQAPATVTPVTPAPVTPPAPTTTPSGATLDANGVVTPAPVTTTPTNPAPTTPVTTPETSTIPPIDKNAEIKAKNEAQMALNKQQAELRQQERNQVAEETKKANMVTDSGAIFNTLKMGGSVPNNNTPEYRQAQSRYNTFKKFTTYDVASLSTALQSGDLLMGTQAFTDLTSDPTMLAKIQRARAFTNGEIDFNTVGEKSGQYVMSNNPSVAQALADGNMTQEEYNQLTNNDEVTTQAKVMTEKKNEYDKYKRQLESIDDEVEQEYEGKTVTDSFKSAIKANRDKGIRKLFNSASDEYQNAMGLYTELKNSATAVLAINMENYKAEQEKQAQIAQEERAVQRSKDALQYEADFNKKQAELALADPATQIKSTLDEFAKLGIVAQGDLTSKLAEFKASGKTLPEYISGLRNQFMSKPEYKKIQELQAGQLSDSAKMKAQQDFDIQKIKLQDSMKDRNIQRVGGTNDNPIYGYIDGNKVVTVSVPGSTTTGTTPTGNIVPVTAGNKTVRLDQVGATGFESAINQLTTAGIPIVVGQGARDQSATIKEMADRYGIPFNASNPAETAGKLRKAGHQVADPGKSNHESGMAIDVYGNSKLDAVTPEQEKILNANGWYSAGIPGDAGHFEYRGGGQGAQGQDVKMQALSLTQGLGGTADERQAFADNVIKVAQRDNISLADAKKKLGYKSADDVEFGKARGAEYKSIKSDTRDKLSNANTALTLLNSPQTAIGDVASIVGFLKTIDPASVARESEVDSVRNARGVVDSLSNQFAQLKEGTKLTDSQRTQLKDAIQTIVNAGNTKYYEYIKDTEQEFKDRGLDPTVYISKTELEKAKGGTQSNTTPVSVGLTGTDLFSEWKNFNP